MASGPIMMPKQTHIYKIGGLECMNMYVGLSPDNLINSCPDT